MKIHIKKLYISLFIILGLLILSLILIQIILNQKQATNQNVSAYAENYQQQYITAVETMKKLETSIPQPKFYNSTSPLASTLGSRAKEQFGNGRDNIPTVLGTVSQYTGGVDFSLTINVSSAPASNAFKVSLQP